MNMIGVPPDSYWDPPDDTPCCYCRCEGDECDCSEDTCAELGCLCVEPEPDFAAIIAARDDDRYGA